MIDYINFYLSGGPNNKNPNLSLGGMPSSYPVSPSVINNLFDNVTTEQAKIGNVEYRCFYIFNDSDDKYLYNSTAYLIQTNQEGATVEIGLLNRTDVQRIKITGNIPSGGNLKLGYENEQFIINWNGLSDFVDDLSYELNNVSYLSDVLVQGTGGGSSHTINITFAGEDDNKNHQLMTVIENNLSGSPSVQISKVAEGSPINTVPVQTSFSEVAPSNINFYSTNINDQINIGKLSPGDGCPIWIKRTITANSIDAIEGDGFILRLTGNPIKFT